MKFVLCFVVLLIAVSAEDPIAAPACPNDNSLPYVNCKTCSKYAICNGKTLVGESECSGATPFCSSNSATPCAATTTTLGCQDTGVGPTVPSSCTGVGYYPSPNDCRQFLVCEKANTAPHPQSCPTGYYYNRDTMRCVRGNVCVTATCGVNLFATFGTTRSYYVLCVANQPPYVFRCPANTLYTAGANPPCVYRCAAEGWFADSEDRRSYYECYRNAALQFEQRKLMCPFSWRFDSQAKICVPANDE